MDHGCCKNNLVSERTKVIQVINLDNITLLASKAFQSFVKQSMVLRLSSMVYFLKQSFVHRPLTKTIQKLLKV